MRRLGEALLVVVMLAVSVLVALALAVVMSAFEVSYEVQMLRTC
jgi:hypothetical protein